MPGQNWVQWSGWRLTMWLCPSPLSFLFPHLLLDLYFFPSGLFRFYTSSFLADIRFLTTTQSLVSLYNSKVILHRRKTRPSYAARVGQEQMKIQNGEWLTPFLSWHHDFKPDQITPEPSTGFRLFRIYAVVFDFLFSLSSYLTSCFVSVAP